jgi:hypothetical protein
MALSSTLAPGSVCFMCFKCMFHIWMLLHVFYLDVAKFDLVLHMLQWLYTYVSNVCFECFSYFIRILQVFLSRCCICYSGYTHMLQAYVSPVLDICCSKCFMLQVFSLAGVRSGRIRSVPSECCICCNGYTCMLQVYV